MQYTFTDVVNLEDGCLTVEQEAGDRCDRPADPGTDPADGSAPNGGSPPDLPEPVVPPNAPPSGDSNSDGDRGGTDGSADTSTGEGGSGTTGDSVDPSVPAAAGTGRDDHPGGAADPPSSDGSIGSEPS